MDASTALDANLVITLIRSGTLDDDLGIILDVIKRRRDAIAALKVSNISVGDIVYISADVSPKVLADARVRVTSFDKGRVKGRLMDTRSTKWREGSVITLHRILVGDVVHGE